MGCGSCGASQPEGEQAASAPPEAPPLGVVEGVVRLPDGAELPSYPREVDARRPPPPESCTPARVVDRQPVRLGEGRGLGGVLVAAAEFDAEVPHEPETRRVAIRDCRLDPPFLVATRGDTLELKNETDYPFMPVMGGGGLAQALLADQTRSFPLDQGGVKTLSCTFAAACGRTDVVVLYHPLHTVTSDAGRFRLEVPAGEELEVHAWHPLFQEASATVTVAAGETRRVELELVPSSPPEPAAPQPAEGDEPQQPEDDSETLF